ncbi:hypothetical protein NL676_016612 [Syzygium grande]|nr:hypothetical protein NL676_016612 [Syzygium grande]
MVNSDSPVTIAPRLTLLLLLPVLTCTRLFMHAHSRSSLHPFPSPKHFPQSPLPPSLSDPLTTAMSNGSNSRRRLLLNTVAVDVGCSCRKPKLFLHSLLKPSSKSKPSSTSTSSSSSSSSNASNHHRRFLSRSHSFSAATDDSTANAAAAAADHSLQYLLDAEADVARSAKAVRGFGRIDDEGGGGREGVTRPVPGLPALHAADDPGEPNLHQGRPPGAPQLLPPAQLPILPRCHRPRLHRDLERLLLRPPRRRPPLPPPALRLLAPGVSGGGLRNLLTARTTSVRPDRCQPERVGLDCRSPRWWGLVKRHGRPRRCCSEAMNVFLWETLGHRDLNGACNETNRFECPLNEDVMHLGTDSAFSNTVTAALETATAALETAMKE